MAVLYPNLSLYDGPLAAAELAVKDSLKGSPSVAALTPSDVPAALTLHGSLVTELAKSHEIQKLAVALFRSRGLTYTDKEATDTRRCLTLRSLAIAVHNSQQWQADEDVKTTFMVGLHRRLNTSVDQCPMPPAMEAARRRHREVTVANVARAAHELSEGDDYNDFVDGYFSETQLYLGGTNEAAHYASTVIVSRLGRSHPELLEHFDYVNLLPNGPRQDASHAALHAVMAKTMVDVVAEGPFAGQLGAVAVDRYAGRLQEVVRITQRRALTADLACAEAGLAG